MEPEETVCGITTEELSAFSSKKDRPNCPECKATKPMSRGICWQCMNCGRQWLKVYRGCKIITSRKNIKCPKCGKTNPVSIGTRWKCSNCNRSWYKGVKNG